MVARGPVIVVQGYIRNSTGEGGTRRGQTQERVFTNAKDKKSFYMSQFSRRTIDGRARSTGKRAGTGRKKGFWTISLKKTINKRGPGGKRRRGGKGNRGKGKEGGKKGKEKNRP